MSAEPNGRTNWVILTSAVAALATIIAGTSVIMDQKIELAVLKTTLNDRIQIAVFESRLVEIETQFRAQDQTRNIQWADQRRWTAMIYEKVYGQPYPSQQFYPEISK